MSKYDKLYTMDVRIVASDEESDAEITTILETAGDVKAGLTGLEILKDRLESCVDDLCKKYNLVGEAVLYVDFVCIDGDDADEEYVDCDQFDLLIDGNHIATPLY